MGTLICVQVSFFQFPTWCRYWEWQNICSTFCHSKWYTLRLWVLQLLMLHRCCRYHLFPWQIWIYYGWGLVVWYCCCALSFPGANSLSRLLRYMSTVLLISSIYNSIAYIFFSIYSTTFIAWDFVWDGGDFDMASGFPVPDLFYNTWLK